MSSGEYEAYKDGRITEEPVRDWQDRQQEKEDELTKKLKRFTTQELEFEITRRKNEDIELKIEKLRKKQKDNKSPY